MTSAAEAAPSHPLHGRIDTAALRLEWAEAPWDTAVFGHPVVQVSRIEARTGASAADLAPFVAACEVGGVGLASCRLPHDRLRESMLLEEVGFRFIEMVFQPEFGDLQSAGPRTLRWDGRNDAGQAVGAGIYFVKLRSPFGEESRRVTVVR